MDEIDTLWREFGRALLETARGAPMEPLSPATLDALAGVYELPTSLRQLFAEAYPRDGVRVPYVDGRPSDYEGSVVFPSVEWLLELRREDAAWPRAWLPVAVTGDHYVQFVRSEVAGVWALHNDNFGGGAPYETSRRDYSSIAAFLRAATATFRHLRPESFHETVIGGWPFRQRIQALKPDVVARIRAESCRPEEGTLLLPQCGVTMLE